MTEEIRTVAAVIRPLVASDGVDQGVAEVSRKLGLLRRGAEGTVKSIESIGKASVSGTAAEAYAQKMLRKWDELTRATQDYNKAINGLQAVQQELRWDEQIRALEGINSKFKALPNSVKLVTADLLLLSRSTETANEKINATARFYARAMEAAREAIEKTETKARQAQLFPDLDLDKVNGSLKKLPEMMAKAEQETNKAIASLDAYGAGMQALEERKKLVGQAFLDGKIKIDSYTRALSTAAKEAEALRAAEDRRTGVAAKMRADAEASKAAADALAKVGKELAELTSKGTAARANQNFDAFFGIKEFRSTAAAQRREYEQHWEQMLSTAERAQSLAAVMQARIAQTTGMTLASRNQSPADAQQMYQGLFGVGGQQDQNNAAALLNQKQAAIDLANSYDRLGGTAQKLALDEEVLRKAFVAGDLTADKFRAALAQLQQAKQANIAATNALGVSVQSAGKEMNNLYQSQLVIRSALINTFQSVAAGQGIFNTLLIQATQSISVFGGMSIAVLAVGAAIAVAGVALTAFAFKIAQTGDLFVQAQGKLNAFLGDAKKSMEIMERLQQLGSQTGVNAADSASVFSRLLVGGEQIGATTAEMERLLETFQKLGRISSATNQELVAGMRQFTQALGKGKLDGDEFRSVLENLPEVVRVLGREMGKSTEELRAMGTAGQLTSRLVFDALLRGAADADRRFAALPVTMELAFGRLQVTSVGVLVELDKMLNISSTIAQVYTNIAGQLERFRQFLRQVNEPGNLGIRADVAQQSVVDAETRLRELQGKLTEAQAALAQARALANSTPAGNHGVVSAIQREIATTQELINRQNNLINARRRANAAAQAAAQPGRSRDLSLQQAQDAALAHTTTQNALRAQAREREEQAEKLLRGINSLAAIQKEADDARTLLLARQRDIQMETIDAQRNLRVQNIVDPSNLSRIAEINREILRLQQEEQLVAEGINEVEQTRLDKIRQFHAAQAALIAARHAERTRLENMINNRVEQGRGQGGSEEINYYRALSRAVEEYRTAIGVMTPDARLLNRAIDEQNAALERLDQRYQIEIGRVDLATSAMQVQNRIRELEIENTAEARAEIERLTVQRQVDAVEQQRAAALVQINLDLLHAQGDAQQKLLDLRNRLNAAYDRQVQVAREDTNRTDRAAETERKRMEAEITRLTDAMTQSTNRANLGGATEEIRSLVELSRVLAAYTTGVDAAQQNQQKLNLAQQAQSQTLVDLGKRYEEDLAKINLTTAALLRQTEIRRLEALGTVEAREEILRINHAHEQAEATLERDITLRRLNIDLLNSEGEARQTVLRQIEAVKAAYESRAAAIENSTGREARAVRSLQETLSRALNTADTSQMSPELRTYSVLARELENYTSKVPAAVQSQELLARASQALNRALTDLRSAYMLQLDGIEQGTRDMERSNEIRLLEAQNTEASRARVDELVRARQVEQVNLERSIVLRGLQIQSMKAEGEALLALQVQIDEVNAAFDRRVAVANQPTNRGARAATAQMRQVARELEALEKALAERTRRGEEQGAAPEIRSYERIGQAAREYQQRTRASTEVTRRLAEAQTAQRQLLTDLADRYSTLNQRIEQTAVEMEHQNRISQLEAQGTRAAHDEISRLTLARQVETIELQRQESLRQLNLSLLEAEGEARNTVLRLIESTNRAYDRQLAAARAPENSRSYQNGIDAQRRALDNATKEAGDFFFDYFEGRATSIGEVLERSLKRAVSDALAEELLRPLMRPIISAFVGEGSILGSMFSGLGGSGGQSFVTTSNPGLAAVAAGAVGGIGGAGGLLEGSTGPAAAPVSGGLGGGGGLLSLLGMSGGFSGIGTSLNGWAASAFPSIFGAGPVAAPMMGANGMVTGGGLASSGTAAMGTGATFMGSLGGIAGGFAIGSMLGNLTAGDSKARQTNGTIGAGVGSLAGFAIGSMLGGPIVGALIGGALGGAGGGLLGPRKGFSGGDVIIKSMGGELVVETAVSKNFDMSEAEAAARTELDKINQAMKEVGLSFKDGVWAAVGAGESKNPQSVDAALKHWGSFAALSGDSERLQGVLQKNNPTSIEDALELGQETKDLEKLLRTSPELVGTFMSAWNELNDTLAENEKIAKKLGFGEEELAKIRSEKTAQMLQERSRALEDYSINLSSRAAGTNRADQYIIAGGRLAFNANKERIDLEKLIKDQNIEGEHGNALRAMLEKAIAAEYEAYAQSFKELRRAQSSAVNEINMSYTKVVTELSGNALKGLEYNLQAFDLQTPVTIEQTTKNLEDLGFSAGVVSSLLEVLIKTQGLQRQALIDEYNERKRLAAESLSDRLFAVGNDTSTIEGALAAYDRTAGRERIAAAKEGLVDMLQLEQVQAAERLKIVEDFAKRTNEVLKQLGEGIRNYIDGLNVNEQYVTPQARLAAAQTQYQQDLTLAGAGDQEALGRITSKADEYIQAAQSMYSNTPQFYAVLDMIKAQLANLPVVKSYDQQMVEQLQLIATGQNQQVIVGQATLAESVKVLMETKTLVSKTTDSVNKLAQVHQSLDQTLSNLLRSLNTSILSLIAVNQGGFASVAMSAANNSYVSPGWALQNADLLAGKGGTDSQFVTQMYKTLLRREPDSAGLAQYTKALAGGFVTRADIYNAFLASTEMWTKGYTANAMGNAFSNGSVTAFAMGGVLEGPTSFPMAGGKMGLAGEAGYEGLLPLDRMEDGHLGVNASGMFQDNSEGVIQAIRDLTEEVRELRRESVKKSIQIAQLTERVAEAVEGTEDAVKAKPKEKSTIGRRG